MYVAVRKAALADSRFPGSAGFYHVYFYIFKIHNITLLPFNCAAPYHISYDTACRESFQCPQPERGKACISVAHLVSDLSRAVQEKILDLRKQLLVRSVDKLAVGVGINFFENILGYLAVVLFIDDPIFLVEFAYVF